MRQNYNVYGTFRVTTEGDCEGRTTTDLGTHRGYLDEIAFKLADRCFYSLRFDQMEEGKIDKMPKKGTKVNVSLNIDSGTWDMKPKEQVKYFQELLSGRNIGVSECNYFAAVTLYDGSSPEEQTRKKKELAKQTALSKLSKEDKEALGIKE